MLSGYAAGSDVSKLAIPDDGGDVVGADAGGYLIESDARKLVVPDDNGNVLRVDVGLLFH